MNKNIVIILGVLLFICLFIFMFKGIGYQVERNSLPVRIAYVKYDIKAGTIINEEYVGYKDIVSYKALKDIYKEGLDVIGKRAKTDIKSGEYFTYKNVEGGE